MAIKDERTFWWIVLGVLIASVFIIAVAIWGMANAQSVAIGPGRYASVCAPQGSVVQVWPCDGSPLPAPLSLLNPGMYVALCQAGGITVTSNIAVAACPTPSPSPSPAPTASPTPTPLPPTPAPASPTPTPMASPTPCSCASPGALRSL